MLLVTNRIPYYSMLATMVNFFGEKIEVEYSMYKRKTQIYSVSNYE
jgi:hypothetical protein